jgi:hypothetical protein
MGSCPNSDLFDDIGDYEGQLTAWYSMNVLDYRLLLINLPPIGKLTQALITVKNGIPESSDPPGWLTGGDTSTVPEVFSFVKKEAKKKRSNGSLIVLYDIDYHYPRNISYVSRTNPDNDWTWTIMMAPLVEVENEQEAWNAQNLLDYKLSVIEYHRSKKAEIMVKNGIPESSDPPDWLAGGNMSTVQEFFSFVKEEEKRWEGVHFLMVAYHPVYHYPRNIYGAYHWYITLTPLGETE